MDQGDAAAADSNANTFAEELQRATERYGALPKKRIKPAVDKKVLPDSIEIARDLENGDSPP